MHIPFVDLKAQYRSIKKEIDNALSSVLNKATFIGGNEVQLFEQEFAAYMQVDYCVSCANGTDAIEIALEALGIGANDEVLVPAYTWISTASAVNRVGAIPVLVDVDPEYYTIDVAQAASKITESTKAILPVHFYGLAANMPAILKLAKNHNLFIIEDCAQAHNATINGQKVGSFGDIATYSFYPGKNLGAYGDGGAICTSNKTYAEKARIIASLGQKGKHNHISIGRNSRLDALQAAVLRVKLPYLNKWTLQRQQVAKSYNNGLKELPITLPAVPEGYAHVYHLFVIQTTLRDKLKQYLEEHDIHAQVHYPKPLNQVGLFKYSSNCTRANDMSNKLLSLPIYAELTNEQVAYVIKVIRSFLS